MTSSIKPPGAPPVTPGAASPSEAPSKPTGASFQDAVQGAAQDAVIEAGDIGARGAEAATSVDLGAELRAGRVTASEVVDQLVQKALASPEAQLLSDAGRARLESHLRDELANDPSLQAMVDDLG